MVVLRESLMWICHRSALGVFSMPCLHLLSLLGCAMRAEGVIDAVNLRKWSIEEDNFLFDPKPSFLWKAAINPVSLQSAFHPLFLTPTSNCDWAACPDRILGASWVPGTPGTNDFICSSTCGSASCLSLLPALLIWTHFHSFFSFIKIPSTTALFKLHSQHQNGFLLKHWQCVNAIRGYSEGYGVT